MGRLVREWMSSPAIFIDPDASVAHAMTLMRRRGIHSLVVSLDERKYGILTTTDIRDKIVAEDRDPRGITVKQIMSSPVLTADPGWDLKECSIRMQRASIHHLPVVDGKQNVIGMISATDIFAAVEEIGWEER